MAWIAKSGRELTHVLLLLFCCGLFFFIAIDRCGLWDPFESFWAEIGREMQENGSWLTPQLNYQPYLDYPFLNHWLLTFVFNLLGVSTASARLLPATLATLNVLLIYLIGRRLFNPKAGFWSALVLTSSFLFIAAAQHVSLWMSGLLALNLSVLALSNAREKFKRSHLLWALSLALGFLSQGLTGLIMPIFLLIIFVFMSGEGRLPGQLFRLKSSLFFLLLCLAWYVLASVANPHFSASFWAAQWDLFFSRPPFWHLGQFILLTLAGLLPWLIMLPWALKQVWPSWRGWRQPANRPFVVLAAWLFSMLLLLLALNLQGQWLALPLIPPLALIVGLALSHFVSYGLEGENSPLLRRCLCLLSILLLFFSLALAIAIEELPALSSFRLSALILPLLPILLAALLFHWRGRWWMAVVGPLGCATIIMLCLLPVLSTLGSWYSSKTAVQATQDMLLPDDQLVAVGDNYPGLAFYSQSRIQTCAEKDLPQLFQRSQSRLIVICSLEQFNTLEPVLLNTQGIKIVEWLRLDGQVVFSNQPH